MDNVRWEKSEENTHGISTIGYKNLGVIYPDIPTIVGYNNITGGEEVVFDGRDYTVVMVSRLGYFGLSSTGRLPYDLTVVPGAVTKKS